MMMARAGLAEPWTESAWDEERLPDTSRSHQLHEIPAGAAGARVRMERHALRGCATAGTVVVGTEKHLSFALAGTRPRTGIPVVLLGFLVFGVNDFQRMFGRPLLLLASPHRLPRQ